MADERSESSRNEATTTSNRRDDETLVNIVSNNMIYENSVNHDNYRIENNTCPLNDDAGVKRELTQTDHLNKTLLNSFLKRLNENDNCLPLHESPEYTIGSQQNIQNDAWEDVEEYKDDKH